MREDGFTYAVRQIGAGDENLLTPAEALSLQRCALASRRQAAAARVAARALLAAAGQPAWDLPRRNGLAPRWPAGFVGSLAHCDSHAAAVLAPAHRFAAVGIDIEPAAPLPAEVYCARGHGRRAPHPGWRPCASAPSVLREGGRLQGTPPLSSGAS